MKIDIKNISSTVNELTITIEAAEASKEYAKVLNTFKKMVVVPGFRKGKAPQHMLEKLYGESAKEEFFNQKLGQYYKQALDENDINPINQGEVTNAEWEKGADLVAVYRYEVMPEIKLEKVEGLEIPYEKTEFKPEMVEATIEDFRKQMGSEEEVEVASDKNDIITATFKFLDEEGNETGKKIDREFLLNDNPYCASFNSKLTGSKVGAKIKTILFTKASKHIDKEITSDLFGKKFMVEVNGIKRTVFPEINDDFAKDLEYDSLDEMKKKVEDELISRLNKEDYDRRREAIIAELIKANPCDLPKSMITNYANNMAKPYAEQYNMDIEQIIPLYMMMAENNLKSHYLLEEYKKVMKIEVTDEDKEDIIKEAAVNMKIEVEKYKELYQKQISSEDFIYAAAERKALNQIAEKSTFVPYPKEEVIEEDAKA